MAFRGSRVRIPSAPPNISFSVNTLHKRYKAPKEADKCLGADRVQILTFAEWASVVSLAIQLWEKATGKNEEAGKAKAAWDGILQGGEAG